MFCEYAISVTFPCVDPNEATEQNECTPSEYSDKHGHPPGLIRVFTLHQRVPKEQSFIHAHSEHSDQAELMPRLS